jgi:glycosyltransferase involved in cell wall biosynthesis
MFICQVIASHGNGGLEKHVRELSRCLVAHGHRVLIIGDVDFVNTLPEGVERESINMRLSRHHPWLLFQLYLKLRKYNFDVIHAQANKAASMLSSIKMLLKTPLIATVHNIKSQFKIYKRFLHVICVSRHLASLVNTHGTEVIYNGIQNVQCNKLDLAAQYHLPRNHPIICVVGRLVPAKGFDVLLEAIDGLDVSLIVAGDGPQKRVLEKRLECMHPNTQVRLIGHCDHPSDLMFSADGVIISSRREGFSYVFNEALMCGANILSTDVPVANEVLPSELIVAVDDAAKLREKLIMLLNTPEAWAALMQGAHQFARQHMTITQMTEKTINLYQRIQ